MADWVRVDEAPKPARRSTPATPDRTPVTIPPFVEAELATALGPEWKRRRDSIVRRMQDTTDAYGRRHYADALRIGRPLLDVAPMAPSVLRVMGLAAYRANRWRAALTRLELLNELTSEPENLPLIMDCHRALGRSRRVTEVFEELRQLSPSPDVLAEGRLVLAGSLADRNKMAEAIEVLKAAGAERNLRNPGERHLRQWYAMGDLYERAGEISRSRTFFERVWAIDPEAFDVASRLDSLGGATPRRRRPAKLAAKAAPKA